MSKVVRLPKREQIKTEHTWDLSSLYPSDQAGKSILPSWIELIEKFLAKYEGKLAESAKTLAACLKFDSEFDRLAERVGNYAFLKTAENQADSNYQGLVGRFQNLATRASQAASFMRPELLAIPEAKMKSLLEDKLLKPYRLLLERILRYRPYTLTDREEKLLAMQGEMAQASSKAFRQLVDADLKFGLVRNEVGEQVELSQATFMQMLYSPKRSACVGRRFISFTSSSKGMKTRSPLRWVARFTKMFITRKPVDIPARSSLRSLPITFRPACMTT